MIQGLVKFRFFLLVSILFSISSCVSKKTEALFETMDSAYTNITFINHLEPISGKLSIVDYLYYYNGGGVAAGDINNDGLTDLYFVSNTGGNRLYLNRGNFKFEDITEKSGVSGFSEWQTGVTMADVNGDGYLDFYVCAVADYLGLEGSNELYINNGDETFTEKASEYELDFSGFSTQSVFFDYDHDGDLDMYLLNHSVHTSRSYDKVIARLLPDKSAGDYLFRNDNGKFIDVSQESGIYQAAMGYGLGVTVADVNNDGWEDLYVTNDFHEDDYYYINTGNGTFTEKGRDYFQHFSRFSMGCDVADINNDGYQDIMTLDMYPETELLEKTSIGEDPWDLYQYKLSYGFHYQFSRNCLQINNGGKSFSDWGIMAGVSATDWSWSTLLADFNQDGHKDIFVSNGINKRPTDLDYLKYSHEDSMLYASELNRTQLALAIRKMPEGKAHNYLFEGGDDLIFKDRSADWGFEISNISNGAAYADLDNDGDLDLITNNLNEVATIYRNHADKLLTNNYVTFMLHGDNKNRFGLGAKVYVKTSAGFQMQQMMPTRGFLSSVEPRLNFGLGMQKKIDSVIVVWNDQRSQILTNVDVDSLYELKQADASMQQVKMALYKTSEPVFEDITDKFSIDYVHHENKYSDFYRESLMPFMVSQEGPALAVGDVNGDGTEDFFVGGAKHQAGSIFFQRNNSFVKSKQQVFLKDSIFEDVDAELLDVDSDGDLDLYVVSGGNEFYGKMAQQFDRLYRNDGSGNFERDSAALPSMHENKSCVRANDFDGDGDLDLFVGGRVSAYNYGKVPKSFLLLNDGSGRFSDVTDQAAPGLRFAGMITDAAWFDFDKDGDQDLALVGDWMPLRIFINQDGKFNEAVNVVDEHSSVKNVNGFWQCLSIGDFDRDGDSDLLVGNLGLNSKLIKNGQGAVLKMFINDFDENGQQEQLVAYQRADGKFYPIASKDELGKQMPSIIHRKFTTYKDFAGKNVDEIFEKHLLDSSRILEVDQFASMLFENTGNKTFLLKPLPRESQLSKVFSIYSHDFDEDGDLDVILGGNYFGGSSYQSTYDAGYGLLLLGDGAGEFESIPAHKSGLLLEGQVRKIKPLRTSAGDIYLVSRNGSSVQVIK